ncbi:hypothetical protein [Streptomyces angustmyceticus]|uniref:hypothetical protein n=1 Tax=Streptomyces angustmyceticus TaxID=285578 RepID=UPI003D935754
MLPDGADPVRRAIGERAKAVRVLPAASDATTADRLAGRERGSELAHETEASVRKARLLDEQTPTDAWRVATDGREVADIAREVVGATGWLPRADGCQVR